MKILIKICVLTALIIGISSCTHLDEKMSFNISLSNAAAKIGDGKKVKVSVEDQRQSPKIVGRKKFGDEKIKITSEQDLAIYLREQIEKGLKDQGFVIAEKKSTDVKPVLLQIRSFKYEARSGFLIGKSKFDAEILLVIDAKNNSRFSKKYFLSSQNKHFLRSSREFDINKINSSLQEIVNDILKDEELLGELSK
jgi:uncharacterized lipoprotein YajG